jgi:hypothetical protein
MTEQYEPPRSPWDQPVAVTRKKVLMAAALLGVAFAIVVGGVVFLGVTVNKARDAQDREQREDIARNRATILRVARLERPPTQAQLTAAAAIALRACAKDPDCRDSFRDIVRQSGVSTEGSSGGSSESPSASGSGSGGAQQQSGSVTPGQRSPSSSTAPQTRPPSPQRPGSSSPPSSSPQPPSAPDPGDILSPPVPVPTTPDPPPTPEPPAAPQPPSSPSIPLPLPINICTPLLRINCG